MRESAVDFSVFFVKYSPKTPPNILGAANQWISHIAAGAKVGILACVIS